MLLSEPCNPRAASLFLGDHLAGAGHQRHCPLGNLTVDLLNLLVNLCIRQVMLQRLLNSSTDMPAGRGTIRALPQRAG